MKSLLFMMIIGSLTIACAGRSRGPSVVVNPPPLQASESSDAQPHPTGSPVSKHGTLNVFQGELRGAGGAAVQLRGVSTAGLTINPKLYNMDSLRWLRDDWQLGVIRAAMIDINNADHLLESQAKIEELIEAAVELGLYIIIEWRVARNNDPFTGIDQATVVLEPLLRKYGLLPNVLYEVSFEGAHDPGAWDATIKPYAQTIVPLIRQHSANGVIILEGPPPSTLVDEINQSPLADYNNVMIGLHFDIDAMTAESIQSILSAKAEGYSIFITHFSPASPDGRVAANTFNSWLDRLAADNISWTASALTTATQPDALLSESAAPKGGWELDDLSSAGGFIRTKIIGDAPGIGNDQPDDSKDEGIKTSGSSPTGGKKDTSPGDLPEIVTPDDTL